jgi:hypothetical protein
MDKAGKGPFYHLGSALSARDSCNRVSWLSTHLLGFPAHEAYRKELRKRETKLKKKLLYNPASTVSLVRKWGPSTRNILRSMEYTANRKGPPDKIENDAKKAAAHICNNALAMVEGSIDLMEESEGSSLIFLRPTPKGIFASEEGKRFIPTPYLRALFEEKRRGMKNNQSLQLFRAFSHTP